MKMLDFSEYLERRRAECEPCVACGQPGTWNESGICTACLDVARQSVTGPRSNQELERFRNDRSGTLIDCRVRRRQAEIEFKEPERWPVDPRRPGLRVCDWEGSPSSLLLRGPTGTGKTMLAVELLYQKRCKGWACQFVRASRLPRVYFNDNAAKADELEAIKLLVVDDLGRGHLGRAWEAIGELLASRYDDLKSTIITSNLKLVQIAEFDAHAADRLSEGLVVTLAGESRRDLKIQGEPRTE